MNCTRFGLHNTIETYVKGKWGLNWNNSDRYNCQGVGPRGSSMSSALNSVRKVYGVVPEDKWPSDWNNMSRSEYFKVPPKKLIGEGKEWINKYSVSYEEVGNNRNRMKEALKYSPLYVAGYAWYNTNGLYRSYGRANHVYEIYGYEDGKCWKAFDSYYPYKKKLAWDYQFQAVKRLSIEKENNVNMLLEKLLSKGIEYVMRTETAKGGKGEVYKLKKDGSLEYSTIYELNNDHIKELVNKKVLEGISEADYNKLK